MKKWLIILTLAALLLTGCRQAEQDAVTTPTEPEQTEPQLVLAPDFTVYDAEGKAYKLSELRGKPVVLNFWASWCGPCKAEMPDFEAAWGEYGNQIHFMMVNITDGASETLDTATAFVQQSGYTFPVYYDTTMEATSQYGIRSIPTTYFIDARGCAVAYHTGMMDRAMLQQGIDMITEADQN